MNNFVFSQDPLLYSSLEVRQVPQQNEYEMRRQFDDAMTRYQAYSQQGPPPPPPTRDYIGELDSLVSGLDEDLHETERGSSEDHTGGDNEERQVEDQQQS